MARSLGRCGATLAFYPFRLPDCTDLSRPPTCNRPWQGLPVRAGSPFPQQDTRGRDTTTPRSWPLGGRDYQANRGGGACRGSGGSSASVPRRRWRTGGAFKKQRPAASTPSRCRGRRRWNGGRSKPARARPRSGGSWGVSSRMMRGKVRPA